MKTNALRVPILALLLCFGVRAAAAATTLDHEIRLAPDRYVLTPRGEFTDVGWIGAVPEERAGRPDLPWLGERVRLPDGMRVRSVTVTSVETVPLGDGVRLAPARIMAPGLGPLERSAPDARHFGHGGVEPAVPVELGAQGWQAGEGVAVLRVAPLRWSPRTGRLERLTSVRVRLELEPASDEPLRRLRDASSPGAPAPRGSLAFRAAGVSKPGATPFRPTQLPSLEGSPVEYVIITNEEQLPEFQRLADWKTATGVPAVVRTLSFIKDAYPFGSDDAERIRLFLRDAYQRWGTEWVLLGGDTEVLPTRFPYTIFYGGNYIASDLYYSCLDRNWNFDGDSIYGEGYFSPTQRGDSVDLFPEVWVGRAPTVSAADAQQFVDKTLQYAKTPVGDYENDILFFAEVLFPQDWSPGMMTSLDGAELVEEVLPLLDTHPTVRYARLYENHLDARWRPGALLETRQRVLDSLNVGYNMAVHIGHGYRNVMSVGDASLTNQDAISLANGNRLFNLYAINCTSNAIDFPSIGEAFMKAPNGGAVTNIGSTNLDFPTAGRAYQTEYFRLMFQDSVTAVGKAQALAKVPFIGFSTYDGVNRWTQMTLILLGDPELRMWTGTPRTLTVSHPASIAAGDTQFTVHVSIGGTPLYGARVVAWKPGVEYRRLTTDGAGNVTVPFETDSAGSFFLTVTAFDARPYHVEVPITPDAVSLLAIEAPILDDDALDGTIGNGDGLLDAGETVDLRIPVDNRGGNAALAVQATLSTTDSVVSVLVPGVLYGTIPSEGSHTPPDAFRIAVPFDTEDQREIPFTLTLVDVAGRHTERRFTLVVRAPEIRHMGHAVADAGGTPNGRPDAGETVTYTLRLRNYGTGPAQGLSAALSSMDGLATVTDGVAAFPDLAPGAEATGDGVTFVLGSTAAKLQLVVSDVYGPIFTQVLDVVPPDVPTSIVGQGAATNIRLQWRKVADADLQGYVVYRGPSASGPWTRVNVTPTDRTAYYLDEGLAPLTRYYYYVTAVDSSGNESSPSAVTSFSTNPPSHAVFPIEMSRETPASVAVDHVWPDHPLSIVAGADVLYAFHPDGSSPVDADGAGSTPGDFTRRGAYYAAGPSIADLDGDGMAEIVGTSWDSTGAYAFRRDGSVIPGWPVKGPDPVWSCAALGDVTGDGLREVIWGSNGNRIHATSWQGVELLDGDANPATHGVFKVLGAPYNFSTPAIADLDGNGINDIIVGGADGWLYAWRADGSNLPGFPVYLGGSISASVAVGYLDGAGDTQLDIVAPATDDSLYVLRADGSHRPGFPQWIKLNGTSKTPSPALADINNDGYLDIVQASTNGGLYVYQRTGALLFPWLNVRYSPYTSGASESSPVVADINGDGWNDILMGDESTQLTAFSGNGATMLAGFPIVLAGEIRGTPAVCDCDGDGLTEIVLAGWDKNVYVWDYDFPFSPGGPPAWPQFHHDAARTGLASNPAFVDVPDGGGPVGAPQAVAFAAPAPNPARGLTRLSWSVPRSEEAARFEVAAFDLAGRLVRTIAAGPASAGRHTAEWDLRDASGAPVENGVYFLRFSLGATSATRKLVVLR
uniref:T9SS type A sorting domain-containing protein n=1 Tax=Eiseniibacteriota bacterium TaxID=2212470 RepID=A0A832MJU2_UNCEI